VINRDRYANIETAHDPLPDIANMASGGRNAQMVRHNQLNLGTMAVKAGEEVEPLLRVCQPLEDVIVRLEG
jgi:hypothetical protein